MEKEKPAEIKIEEILSSNPVIEVREYDAAHSYGTPMIDIHVSLPYGNHLRATIREGESSAEIQNIFVVDEFREKGVGEKLLRAIVVELKSRGVKTVTGSLDHIGALKNRVKVFGEENIRLHAHVGENWEVGKELTYEEAQEELSHRRYVFCEGDLKESVPKASNVSINQPQRPG